MAAAIEHRTPDNRIHAQNAHRGEGRPRCGVRSTERLDREGSFVRVIAGRVHDVRSKTCRTVAAYHRLPAWAARIFAWIRLSAIARNESPRARCRWIRRTTDCGRVGGRPSLTPAAFLAASASFVR